MSGYEGAAAVLQARAVSARMFGGTGESYAAYIAEGLRESVARGSMTYEEALGVSLGSLLEGNNGN